MNRRRHALGKQLLDFNDRCAVVFIGSKLFVAWTPRKGATYKFISHRDFLQREAIKLVEVKTKGGEKKTLKMADEWLKWRGRRQYVDVRFAPGLQDETVFNLFTGFAFDAAAGDWSKLRDHLRYVICQDDPNAFAWLMTYLAHLFQRPGEKPPTALVISGKKGTGKSIVFDFIQSLMPQHFSKVADGKRALGNFNSQNETALFVLMEEAVWAGDLAAESVLKDMITSPTQRIERKGVDAYMAPSYFRMALLSNADWVVPASFDERRFAVFKCGDQHRGDIGYFKAMVEQMNDGGTEAMLFDLLNYVPDNGWDVLRTPPVTVGLQEQIVASLRGLDQFMLQLATDGLYECEKCEGGGVYLDETRPTSVNIIDVRAAARDHMIDNYPGKKAATVGMIDHAVREWFGAVVVKRKVQTNEGRWVEFPPLADVREHLRRAKRIDIHSPS
ncbi:primase-helicase family protein [Sphingomonas sp. CCH5-D11]|uniref:primase-helicase family protein n=1 Tax=Sphingomonas sp. CCH5-D11 TaxID=1768786 RepID=UPI000837A8F9|nr:primase-helicase family protein [Sphingomonas sp. CCH5-D11]